MSLRTSHIFLVSMYNVCPHSLHCVVTAYMTFWPVYPIQLCNLVGTFSVITSRSLEGLMSGNML